MGTKSPAARRRPAIAFNLPAANFLVEKRSMRVRVFITCLACAVILGGMARLPADQPAKGEAASEDKTWAFRPVKRPNVPAVRDRDWVRPPLDAFILAKLEKKSIKPAPMADRRTLLRRVYLDL